MVWRLCLVGWVFVGLLVLDFVVYSGFGGWSCGFTLRFSNCFSCVDTLVWFLFGLLVFLVVGFDFITLIGLDLIGGWIWLIGGYFGFWYCFVVCGLLFFFLGCVGLWLFVVLFSCVLCVCLFRRLVWPFVMDLLDCVGYDVFGLWLLVVFWLI